MANRRAVPKNLMVMGLVGITFFFVLLIVIVTETSEIDEAPKEIEKLEEVSQKQMAPQEFKSLVEKETAVPPPEAPRPDDSVFADLPPEPEPEPAPQRNPGTAPPPPPPAEIFGGYGVQGFQPNGGYGVPGGSDSTPEVFEAFPDDRLPPSARNNRPLVQDRTRENRASGPEKEGASGKPEANPSIAGDGRYEPEVSQALLLEKAPSPLMLRQGAVIRCVLTGQINTQNPGRVQLRVVSDVYDSLGRRQVVIPKGSVLTGAFDSKRSSSIGLDRVPVAVDRLLLPDGRSVLLGNMGLTDAMGNSGVPAEFHSNLLRAIGPGALVAWLGYRIDKSIAPSQAAGGQNTTAISTISQALLPTLDERLNSRIAADPYYTIDAGEQVTLVLAQDIAFPTIR